MRTKALLATLAVAATVVASACGSSGHAAAPAAANDEVATTTSLVTRPTGLVDELVAVEGGRLHLHCAGTGPSTVVLIAGFGGTRDSWTAVEPAVAQTSRVCSYDRFGDGTSDVPPAPQTFASEAVDLHRLLENAGEPGPYVLVGHSFGGAEAVSFASKYPTQVHGVLLVDASPPTWNHAICAVPDDGSDTAHTFQSLCASQSLPSDNREHLDAPTAFAQVGDITSLSATSLIVVTADHHSYPGLAAEEEARLNTVWNAGQAHWASLTSSAPLVTVDRTGHNIQLDRPDVVLDKIRQLLP
jgi:pimeloyl-ACP methyl ester carboxylesterase